MAQLAAFRIPNIENEPNVRECSTTLMPTDGHLMRPMISRDSNIMSLVLLQGKLFKLH
jgi:hypothetical protein